MGNTFTTGNPFWGDKFCSSSYGEGFGGSKGVRSTQDTSTRDLEAVKSTYPACSKTHIYITLQIRTIYLIVVLVYSCICVGYVYICILYMCKCMCMVKSACSGLSRSALEPWCYIPCRLVCLSCRLLPWYYIPGTLYYGGP